jgi:hypothetical protein
MLDYKILSTAVLLSAQYLIGTSAVPLQAEGTSCQYLGCKADGTSREYCQGGSTTVSGQVKLCPEAQVCIMTDLIQGNFHCGSPGQAPLQAPAVQPSAPPAEAVPSQSTSINANNPQAIANTHMDGWKDKQQRTGGDVTFYAGGSDACGGFTSDNGQAEEAPFYAAVDVGFFPDPTSPTYNPNKATVCNKKVRLSCK